LLGLNVIHFRVHGFLFIIFLLGLKLKGVADAAKNYHVVLEENRRLYNEVQELKGKTLLVNVIY